MEIHKKILICSLFVLTVCLLSGCEKEKEIEMKLPKDETLEISLPQYQPSHFWCMEENITLNVMNYNKKEVSVPEKLEGVTSNVQKFSLNVTENNNVSFKWVNVNECGKSFSEKQADYLLKIKIVKE